MLAIVEAVKAKHAFAYPDAARRFAAAFTGFLA
jgi:hypothetical protein